jgi:hypothetical protein
MDALVWALTELMLPANLGMLDFMAAQHAEAKQKRTEELKRLNG